MYKALCDAAGHDGPLYECSFYGNKAAGEKFTAMLSKGASQPWQDTLKELTGGEKMDASAVLEYFAPLQTWLTEQNAGRTCGWTADASGATPAKPAAKPAADDAGEGDAEEGDAQQG
jgi:peptidyl-dipeptidase A